MKHLNSGTKKLTAILAVYVLLAVSFYALGGQQLHIRGAETDDMVTPTGDVDEIYANSKITQPFSIDADHITGVTLYTSTYGRLNDCSLNVSIERAGQTIASATKPAGELGDSAETVVSFAQPIEITPSEPLTLIISSPDGSGGNAVTVYYGSSISVSKGSVDKELNESELARVDGQTLDGILCFQVTGQQNLLFGSIYWYVVAALGVALAAYGLTLVRKMRSGASSPTLRFFAAIGKYRFLMEQLVNRDFKTKYKRSVLGVLWSFLNPLLMMLVQYVVFSTLFKSNIPNFPVYLLTGIVCFNFFNESTNMCLQSISGNAGLITKVYVPKYIYPVTRVLSSSINLLLSLLPLFLVLLITRTPLSIRGVLLIFGILCLEVLALGVGLILCSLMVFFRDTQFIWGVLITILNFATPIFYPESIIPARFMTIYKLNPLYHIVRFFRIVLLDGVSPEPKAYGLCLIAALVPLAIGIVVFKKSQDKFVLNI
ncbi:ABC transporter permease [Oscillibacter sp.]|uniref:ABC transporter permease n=1 Tax=Oscillibacter sp. TaxID=1945593 RepID=UPI00261D3C31|nr:ABC transporter permease [Oscillibacter sp.]MDD3346463.1 ABC transporter permease [Oscillibacter sp.]